MTVIAAEAGEAAGEGAAASTSAEARNIRRRLPRERVAPSTWNGGAAEDSGGGSDSGGGGGGGRGGPSRRQRYQQQYQQQAGYVGSQIQGGQLVPGDRRYQGVILAEYLVAVLLITLSPIATGGSANAKTKSSPSPYDVNDLKQLVAVSGVYFVLALVASGNKGRFSAWFGGLILLAISMSKLGQGGIKAIADIVGQAPEPGQPPGTQLD